MQLRVANAMENKDKECIEIYKEII